ncbi:MAG: hypothetical protein GY841_22115 [FCB group bacterium]|nr:hypothetical protein [FCB group bacterium]
MPVFLYALALAIVGVVPVIGVAVRIEGKKYVTPITGSIVTGGLRLCACLVAGRRWRVVGRRSPGDEQSGAGGRVAGGVLSGDRSPVTGF